ncbi:hypothetical protein ACLKA7_007721 [Drosophila subpalustris]
MTRSFGRLEAIDLLNNFRNIDLANRNRRAGDDTSIRSCGQHFLVRCQIKRSKPLREIYCSQLLHKELRFSLKERFPKHIGRGLNSAWSRGWRVRIQRRLSSRFRRRTAKISGFKGARGGPRGRTFLWLTMEAAAAVWIFSTKSSAAMSMSFVVSKA